MDIESRKIEFLKEFLMLQNEELLTRLEKLLRSSKSSKDDEFKPMTITELNKRIDKSLVDSKNGKLTSSSDLSEEVEEWD